MTYTFIYQEEMSDSMLDSLEQLSHMNRSTCKKVYKQCAGDMAATVLNLQRKRYECNQRIVRSELKRKSRYCLKNVWMIFNNF